MDEISAIVADLPETISYNYLDRSGMNDYHPDTTEDKLCRWGNGFC